MFDVSKMIGPYSKMIDPYADKLSNDDYLKVRAKVIEIIKKQDAKRGYSK